MGSFRMLHLWVWLKNPYQNGMLVSGNIDQNLRNPSSLILSHCHMIVLWRRRSKTFFQGPLRVGEGKSGACSPAPQPQRKGNSNMLQEPGNLSSHQVRLGHPRTSAWAKKAIAKTCAISIPRSNRLPLPTASQQPTYCLAQTAGTVQTTAPKATTTENPFWSHWKGQMARNRKIKTKRAKKPPHQSWPD